MRPWIPAWIVLLGLTLALGTGHARPQGSEDEARTYFFAGLQAYKAGQFLAAGQAFIEARKLSKKPEVSFSIAQAFRRQFQIDHKPRNVRVAVWYYRQYLSEVKQGGRRLDAVRGLSELMPHVTELGIEEVGPPPELQFATSLMVSTPTPGAVVSFDGGPPLAVGQSHEITPGPHQAVVTARGFHSEARQLMALEGRLVAIDIRLREQPARLEVVGADGAEVSVDGRPYGVAPLPRPVELASGRHFVAITERGHEPHAEELALEPGEAARLDVSLERTDQRVGAQVVLGIGATALAASGALAIAALAIESQATTIRDAQLSGPITEDERVEYNDAVGQRDRLVIAAGATGGAGAALVVTGLFLYLLDQPLVSASPTGDSGPAEPPPDDEPSSGIDLLAGPVLTPHVVGARVTGHF